ncbi:hypothetical protein MO973_44680 [Paenibacillus sp. TRM 82003]|uniref:hypothetical protein n=1 Tax=Kineococcus sp. TRM81007 TaxID=2925831 RepID=UPI001F59657D|nr:hypothetical protein [Kineococcus sp. TRM81007]MCI2238630.1 hypothetical protein [Kineococcus sp. TRM81007]MCI3927292.1 hypothetical protein [Paenibacillus sp. TRM 82003]
MTPHLDPERAAPAPVAGPLADDALAEEIELYVDVVVAASESDGPLAESELDRVLGVDDPTGPTRASGLGVGDGAPTA